MEVPELYKMLFYQLPSELILISDQLKIVDINKAKLYGYKREELINQNINKLIDDTTFLNKAIKYKKFLLTRAIHKTNKRINVKVNVSNFDVNSQGYYLLSIEKVDTVYDRYRQIIESSEDLICTHELDGSFEFVSPSVFSMLGYSQQEIESLSPFTFIHQEDIPKTKKSMEDLLNNIDVKIKAYRFRHKAGHYVWLHSISKAIRDTNGKITGLLSISRDITKYKEIENRLVESEERYRLLVQNTPETIAVHDGEEILYVNPAGAKMLGASSKQDIIGRPISDIFIDEDTLIKEDIKLILDGKRDEITTEHTIKGINGEKIDVSAKAIGISFNNKKAILAIVRNVALEKRLKEMVLKNEKLEMAGQLAAGIAHEVRNPVTAVKGFIQLLSVEKKYKDDYIQVISYELSRVEKIISEFIHIANPVIKINEFQNLNITQVARDVVHLLSPQITENSIRISVICDRDYWIDGDKNKLKQVLINIIRNAIDSIGNRGEILIYLKRKANKLAIHIKDNGCGIPIDRIQKLGEPFYSTKEKGTGLGLMLCYKLIELHNGIIYFDSEIGNGTTVTIELPVNQKSINKAN